MFLLCSAFRFPLRSCESSFQEVAQEDLAKDKAHVRNDLSAFALAS